MAFHHFCTEDAARYGIEESIILYNIAFWCVKNLANRKHIHDGNVWTYNTRDAFIEQFPYLVPGKTEKAKRDKMGRILKSLETKGAIVSGNYNKSPYDQTKWYALADPKTLSKYGEISPEAANLLMPQICAIDNSDVSHQERKNEPCSILNTYKERKEGSNKREFSEIGNISDLPLHKQIMTVLLSDELATADPAVIQAAKFKSLEYVTGTKAGKLAAGCIYVLEGLRIETEKAADREAAAHIRPVEVQPYLTAVAPELPDDIAAAIEKHTKN